MSRAAQLAARARSAGRDEAAADIVIDAAAPFVDSASLAMAGPPADAVSAGDSNGCAPGSRRCSTGCVANDKPCDGVCPAGRNLCAGACTDATDPKACGPSCTICPNSTGGAVSCDGRECVVTCSPGLHRCNDTCVSDKGVDHCGDSCVPCREPPGGQSTCVAGKCGIACQGGRSLCNDDACVDLGTDREHCGRCGHQCPGGCAAGACTCPVPSGANLLANGGFNRDVTRWMQTFQGGALDWVADDAAECATSGSMNLRNVASDRIIAIADQCVPVRGATNYEFGARVKVVSAGDDASIDVGWFPAADCSGDPISFDGASGAPGGDAWFPLRSEVTSPGAARGARIQLTVGKSGAAARFDMVFFTPAPGAFSVAGP